MIYKTCSTPVVEKSIDFDYWLDGIRGQAHRDAGFMKRASKVARMYDHKNWLLSHATIISGVQTEKGDNENAKHADHFIHPATEQFINSNSDSWANGTLRNSYKTFIGVDVYTEHVAVPALAKGKVLDSVLREIVLDKRNKISTDYVDILVATNRKFASLVEDILEEKVNGLSMGASLAFTICSRCGHIAHDESGLCKHIMHEKGDWFIDRAGTRRKIAELCGHPEEKNSCVFIESSWVRTPAFKGAVVRNNLMIDDKAAGEMFSKRIEYAHKVGQLRQMATSVMTKAASAGRIVR